MITIVSLFISIIFLLVALTRPRIAFYIFIFSLPFLPRYIGIGVGEEGFAMTQRRIIAGVAFVGFAAYLLWRPNALSRIRAIIEQRRVLPIIITILLIYAVKMFSTVINSGIYNSFYVIDEMLYTVVVLLMVFAFVRNDADVRILFILLVTGLFISEAASIFEKIKGSPLLQGIYSVEVAIQGKNPLLGRMRADIYRSQAFFDNSLLLSQFVCIVLPISWYLRSDRSRKIRVLARTSLVAAPLTLLFVMARSGFIVASLSAMIYGAYYLYKRSGRILKLWLFAMGIIFVFIAGLVVADIFANPTDYYDTHDPGGRSALGRILQYRIVIDSLRQSPLMGWGMTRNYINDLNFLNNLDSYWLRILLEGGVILVILYLILFFKLFAACVSQIKRTFDPEALSMLFAISISLIAIFLYSFFVSQASNNVYLYLFSALLLKRDEMIQNSSERVGDTCEKTV